jgi:hypothetical protein
MQRDYFASDEARKLDTQLKQMYHKHFDEYSNYIEEAMEHHADPHAKKALRIQAWGELVTFGRYADDCYVDTIELSFKRFETAKPGKYARLYANLGIASSLQGAWLMDKMKTAQAVESLHIHGGEIEFIKSPKKTVLRKTFKKLISPPGRFYACVFSDDSCLSYRDDKGEVHMFNLDISSCDTSHEPDIFYKMRDIVPDRLQREFTNLIKQCERPCIMRSIANPKNKVRLVPKGAFLPSGSVLTTSLNTYACFHFIAHIMSQPVTGISDLVAGAEECGYIITIESCNTYHQLQFLKHSPCFDTKGVLQPVLNLGVLIRSSGQVKGDLPGSRKQSLKRRAQDFQAGLLQSTYPYTRFKMLDNMYQTVGKETKAVRKYFERERRYLATDDDEKQVFRIDDDELYKRYNLTPFEIDMMNLEYGKCGYGMRCANSAIDKILSLDYGLHCTWAGG